MREKIVQVKMELRDKADIVAGRYLIGIIASAPTWKYLPAQMTPGFIEPVFVLALHGSVEFEMRIHQRDQPLQAHVVRVLHLRLQVDQAVFQCEAPLKHVWMTLDLDITFAGTSIC